MENDAYTKLLDEYEIKTQEHCGSYYGINIKLKKKSPLNEKFYADQDTLRKGCSNNAYWPDGSNLEAGYIEQPFIRAFNILIKREPLVELTALLISEVNVWSDLEEYFVKYTINFEHEGKFYTWNFAHRCEPSRYESYCVEREI
jgi:hypothetical protein